MRRLRKTGVAPAIQRGRAHPTPPTSPHPNLPVKRARLMGLFLAIAAFGLVARLWWMQIANGDMYLQMAESNHSRTMRTPAPRGMIVDCKGRILATNRSQFAIYAQPSVAKDTLTLSRLGRLLRDSPQDIAETLTSLKKNDYDLIRIAIDVPMSIVTRIEEEKPYLPGVSTGPEPVRWYPNNTVLGNTLGTLGRIDPADVTRYKKSGVGDYSPNDFIGKTGLEARYESALRGVSGGTQVEVDSRGRPIQQLGITDSVPGKTLKLAVDIGVERAAEQVFHEKHWVGGAAAVNPQTGAVIALATSPVIDPNQFATGIDSKNWAALNNNALKPMLNRSVDALYPPGSTFKQVTAAAGLQSGAITTYTHAYCTGIFNLGKAKFRCWERHDDVDFYSAIALSCDVFFYEAGLKMGPEAMSNYALQYPLAKRTGIDLPHEMIGSIPSPEWKQRHFQGLGKGYQTWFGGDTLNTSIGQGYVLVTPLQMALVTATTANGGYVLRPYLVQQVIEADTHKVLKTTRKIVLRRIKISPDNLQFVRNGMRQCVTNGTGKIVDFPTVATGAKTGSAQVHGQDKTHGWFVAFAPFDHPTIACAAVVEHGGHGADSAGIVVKAMMEAYFHIKDAGGQNAKSD